MLKLEGVWKNFGGVVALMDVNLEIKPKQIKAIIGPNGAGKTTLFNVISGILKADKGRILIGDKDISGFSSPKIAALGISRTFQNVELFGHMSVLENIMVGRHVRTRAGFFATGLRLQPMREEERKIRKKSEEILEYVGLRKIRNSIASSLPIGKQRILELGRALATDPKVLLLDEPASGLNEVETIIMSELIRKIRDDMGITILLVEHDMNLVMNISESIVVLNFGEKIAEGTPDEIRNNKLVIDAYLGEEVAI